MFIRNDEFCIKTDEFRKVDPRPPGTIIEQMVEEVDIFPSLLHLHGLPVPVDLEGDSWVPLLQTPAGSSPGKPRIFSQYLLRST